MGVIRQGILGGFSGKVAGVVGTSWKGIAVVKALPLSVANPQTAEQVANRTAFKAVGQDGSKLLVEIVKPLWDRDAQKQSGYNAFVSSNKQAYSSLGVLDVTKLIPTLGKLPETDIVGPDFTAGEVATDFSWSQTQGGSEAALTDIAYAIAFNSTKNIWAISDGSATRDDEAITITFPAVMETGDIISYWLMFQNAKKVIKFKAGSDLSNTVQ